jgi:hypothetical protein
MRTRKPDDGGNRLPWAHKKDPGRMEPGPEVQPAKLGTPDQILEAGPQGQYRCFPHARLDPDQMRRGQLRSNLKEPTEPIGTKEKSTSCLRPRRASMTSVGCGETAGEPGAGMALI